MKVYIVVRSILSVREDVLTIPLQAFDDADGANDHCKKLDEAVDLHPMDKESSTMSGDGFMAGLGIAAVSHRVVAMPVKQSSLIKVPNIQLVKN